MDSLTLLERGIWTSLCAVALEGRQISEATFQGHLEASARGEKELSILASFSLKRKHRRKFECWLDCLRDIFRQRWSFLWVAYCVLEFGCGFKLHCFHKNSERLITKYLKYGVEGWGGGKRENENAPFLTLWRAWNYFVALRVCIAIFVRFWRGKEQINPHGL